MKITNKDILNSILQDTSNEEIHEFSIALGLLGIKSELSHRLLLLNKLYNNKVEEIRLSDLAFILSKTNFNKNNIMEKSFKYNVASHDTMTYLKPRKWWMRLFRFMAQCQSKTIEEQYNLGVRMFDLRIKYDKHFNKYFGHGLVEYIADIDEVLEWLNNKGDCYVRIILENPKSTNIEEYSNKFVHDVSLWVEKYSNIIFFEGRRKYDWKLLIDLGPNPDYVQMVSSVTGTIFDDWYPRLFAWLHNKDILGCGTSHDWLFMDFIGKY